MITVKDLHKHFGRLEVLNGINQHIKPGEKVVVEGGQKLQNRMPVAVTLQPAESAAPAAGE